MYDPFHRPQAALARRDEVLRAMLDERRRSRARSTSGRCGRRRSGSTPGRIYTRISSRTSSRTCARSSQREYGAQHGPLGRAPRLHDDHPAAAAGGRQGDPRRPAVQQRSRGGDRLGRAGHRRDPRHDRGRAAERQNLIGTRTRSTSPRSRRGSRDRRSRRSCSRPRSSGGSIPTRRYYTSAPFTCTDGAVVQPDCRPASAGTSRPTATTTRARCRSRAATLRSDNTVYAQLTLDVGPRYVWNFAQRLGVQPDAGQPVPSIGLGSLVGVAARHGRRVRDVRRGRHLREADGDHEGRAPGRQESTRTRAGASRRRSARSRRGWRGR